MHRHIPMILAGRGARIGEREASYDFKKLCAEYSRFLRNLRSIANIRSAAVNASLSQIVVTDSLPLTPSLTVFFKPMTLAAVRDFQAGQRP